MTISRLKILIKGTVQGVGFRPCVYNVAKQLQLAGFVFNQGDGVAIEIQGNHVDAFLPRLKQSLPKLAIINQIEITTIANQLDDKDFFIQQSLYGQSKTMIAPDTSVCDRCLEELSDPNNHYFDYPFLNCTQCGPRFSITESLPYDRCHTSMKAFGLCPTCADDYHNPANRRHHAQPTACGNCGPSYPVSIGEMAKLIVQGNILATKGLGGYQLICDAQNTQAIQKLRHRKVRPHKAFAIMFANLSDAKRYINVNDVEAKLLTSDARPIVLVDKGNEQLPDLLAPGLNQLGVMLPSTPMHHLLFKKLPSQQHKPPVLVVTSANASGDPIIADDTCAKQQLASIADTIIPHNRHIVARVDDSVLRVIDKQPLLIRRARGFVPKPIKLSRPLPAIVGLGAQQKNTICLIRDDEAFVTQYMGSLSTPGSIELFEQTLSHWLSLLNIEPQYYAHDCHPDFFTSQWAERQSIPTFAIQHHHAHLAAVMAEYQLSTPCLGLALDGYGYGPDGQIWGGELMRLDGETAQHLGQLKPIPIIGGDRAIREPWRMAAGILHQLDRNKEIITRFKQFPMATPLLELLHSPSSMQYTSSCGRLFDAAAALLGICWQSSYEGQAAMQLESLVTKTEILPDGWLFEQSNLSLLPLLHHLADQPSPIQGANLFHGTLIASLTEWLVDHCQQQHINQVILSGGCLANRILSRGLSQSLKQHNIIPYLPQQLPPNDGGISLGQAWLTGLMVT